MENVYATRWEREVGCRVPKSLEFQSEWKEQTRVSRPCFLWTSETDNLEFVPTEFSSNAIIYFFGFINKLLVCWQEQASLSIIQSLSLF